MGNLADHEPSIGFAQLERERVQSTYVVTSERVDLHDSIRAGDRTEERERVGADNECSTLEIMTERILTTLLAQLRP